MKYQVNDGSGWKAIKKAVLIVYIREHFPCEGKTDAEIIEAITSVDEWGADGWYCRRK